MSSQASHPKVNHAPARSTPLRAAANPPPAGGCDLAAPLPRAQHSKPRTAGPESQVHHASRPATAPPTPPASGHRRSRPLSSATCRASTASSPSSPKLVVKLDGRVYRPPSPGDPRTQLEFQADLLLAGPTETVADLESSRREARRRQVELEMRRELLASPTARTRTGQQAAHRMLTLDDSDEDEEEEKVGSMAVSPSGNARTIRRRCEGTPPPRFPPLGLVSPSPSSASSSLGCPFTLPTSPRRHPRPESESAAAPPPPLPAPLAALLGLHTAVERALILHLSTSGSGASFAAVAAAPLSDRLPHQSPATSSPSSSTTTTSPPADATRATLRMPNLVDLPTLSRMLESTGQRLGETELRRLVWAWQGADFNDDDDSEDEEGGPLRRRAHVLPPFAAGAAPGDEVGGLGLIVRRARTTAARGTSSASPAGRVVQTYGIGISVEVKANPQLPPLELVSPSAPSHKRRRRTEEAEGTTMAKGEADADTDAVDGGNRRKREIPLSPASSVGKGREGMSIVALWTQGKEARRIQLEAMLRRWWREKTQRRVKLEEEEEGREDAQDCAQGLNRNGIDLMRSLGTSSTTAGLPLAALPVLGPAVSAIPSTTTPASPAQQRGLPPTFLARRTGGLSHGPPRRVDPALPVASPTDAVDALLQGKPIKAKGGGTAADRAAARRERIQAKQAAQSSSAYQSSFSALSTGESSPTKRSLKRHSSEGAAEGSDGLSGERRRNPWEHHRHQAMLSRLGSVADVVALRCAGRPTPLEEVCTAVANSPLLQLGVDEASEAISFLASHFADFVYLKLVGQDHWVYLRGALKAIDVKERVRIELARAQEALEAA